VRGVGECIGLDLSCMRLIACFNFARSDCDATGLSGILIISTLFKL
jgi:hypothetical protein